MVSRNAILAALHAAPLAKKPSINTEVNDSTGRNPVLEFAHVSNARISIFPAGGPSDRANIRTSAPELTGLRASVNSEDFK